MRRQSHLSKRSWVSGIFKPTVTFVIVAVLLVASTYFAYERELEMEVWFGSWKDVMLMLLGFYFRETIENRRKLDDHKPK